MYLRPVCIIGRTELDIAQGPGSTPWKVAVAIWLKENTQASNAWVARNLGIRLPGYVARLVSAARRAAPSADIQRLRAQCTT